MPQKRYQVDQIILMLRRADVEIGKGKKVPRYPSHILEIPARVLDIVSCGILRFHEIPGMVSL